MKRRYADDTTLLASTEDHLRTLIRKVGTASAKARVELNLKKTKVMSTTHIQALSMDDESLEAVDKLLFLGAMIYADGCCRMDIMRRLTLRRAAMTGLDKIWKDRDLSMDLKTRLVKALVFPIAMYGCEE